MTMDDQTLLVTKADVIAAGFCAPALREWCRAHGFTASDVKAGIPASDVLATGCGLGAACVAKARERALRSRGADV
mgnify:CR=1 FL=1